MTRAIRDAILVVPLTMTGTSVKSKDVNVAFKTLWRILLPAIFWQAPRHPSMYTIKNSMVKAISEPTIV